MDAKINGLAEIELSLTRLGSVAGAKIMRSAMTQAAKPIVERAKALAPTASGALQHAIGTTFKIGKGAGSEFVQGHGSVFTVSVGPRRKNKVAVALYNIVHKTKRKGIYHGHFLEFGHRKGTRKTGRLSRSFTPIGRLRARQAGRSQGFKAGTASGRVPGTHFMRTALQQSYPAATRLLAEILAKKVAAALKKI